MNTTNNTHDEPRNDKKVGYDIMSTTFGALEDGMIADGCKLQSEEEPSEKTSPLLESTCAVRWAKEFMKTVSAHGHGITPSWLDESLMISWFASAMCAQMDADKRKQAKVDAEREVYVLMTKETGQLVAVYSRLPCKSICDRDYSLHLGKDLEMIPGTDIPHAGQGSNWNCSLYKAKVDSLNRIQEYCKIQYQNFE